MPFYKKSLSLLPLFLSAAIFFSFGLYHLGKFETTDEHLWKYGRIKQYWTALAEQDWQKTYINDKPGVTVALFSGIGLLFENSPENTQMAPGADTKGGLFEIYDNSKSERVNIYFRFPVLAISTLSLFLFYWILKHSFASKRTALVATLLVATNPILLGISQIVNPDSFFWIFGALAASAYLALLNTQKRRFFWLAALFTGLALLSKYTAFTLILFYTLALAAKTFFTPAKEGATDWKRILFSVLDIMFIAILALGVFSLLLPATLTDPSYIFKGIGQFFTFKFLFFATFAAATILGGGFFWRTKISASFEKLRTKNDVLLIAALTAFVLLVAFSFLNAWTGQKMVPVQALRDAAYANEPKEFNFRPLIPKGAPELQKNTWLFAMEAYPLVFSLSPLILAALVVLLFGKIRSRLDAQGKTAIFSVIAFVFIYLASTLFAGVVTNARYLILLYPLLAMAAAPGISVILNLSNLSAKKTTLLASFIIIAFGISNFLLLKPFYFSYTNFLLPRSASIHDSWGHGSYEAAQYLNSLPGSADLVIWSNSDTVCRFFNGKCLRSRRIDISKVTPDYFVISKRGALKLSNRFILENNPPGAKDSGYYFEDMDQKAVWELLIDGRAENYLRVIPYAK
ncbi:MAG TPA: phospholipid carrier-dependent glycosyltransferase [Candidatus Moranbacteria bacterium]|nr:phospholipid carrier-dependent glycosyltransferase [Candidatus Moranbacteria bacterium]